MSPAMRDSNLVKAAQISDTRKKRKRASSTTYEIGHVFFNSFAEVGKC